MAVLRPLRVVIDNYPEGKMEELDCPYHPQNPEMGCRKVPFSGSCLLSKRILMEKPPRSSIGWPPGKKCVSVWYFINA